MLLRILAIVCLILLALGVLPPQAGYICLGMDGARMAQPCCPAPDQPLPHQRSGLLQKGRCCTEAPPLLRAAPNGPPEARRDLLATPCLSPGLLVMLVDVDAHAPPRRPRPLARPPDRRPILRI